jgi:hypothetical protein
LVERQGAIENSFVGYVGGGDGDVQPAMAHGDDNIRKLAGGVLGDGDTGAGGVECLGIVENGAHDCHVEEAALPHIREAIAALVLGRAFFEAVVIAGRLGGGGRGVVKEAAGIQEVQPKQYFRVEEVAAP